MEVRFNFLLAFKNKMLLFQSLLIIFNKMNTKSKYLQNTKNKIYYRPVKIKLTNQ